MSSVVISNILLFAEYMATGSELLLALVTFESAGSTWQGAVQQVSTTDVVVRLITTT